MVKVRGPMISIDASGTLGDAITFSKWKGRSSVRRRVVPTNPESGPQTGRRSMFAYLTKLWDSLTAPDQATWLDRATERNVALFHGFLSVNMDNWHNFMAPSYAYPPARGDAIGTWDASCAAEWLEHRIHLEPEQTILNQNAGILIFASLTGAFTTAVANCILCEPATSTGLKHFYWTPPSVATWYFNHRAFSIEGVLGPQRTESSAVPP